MKYFDLLDRLLTKNRTIASKGMNESMSIIAEASHAEIEYFASGEEYSTWIVPEEWDVVEAYLEDGNGNRIADYEEHPLFVAPYSMGFEGEVTYEELLGHVVNEPDRPGNFIYEYRLACNYALRLNDWRISVPYERMEKLDRNANYRVKIDVVTESGNMLVADSLHEGRTGFKFSVLSHLCHPGQANDGLVGVLLGLDWMDQVKSRFGNTRHSYNHLILPETIGSSIYLTRHIDRAESYLGTVFVETPGIEQPLWFKRSFRGSSYVDRVIRYVLEQRGLGGREFSFREGFGNDELVFGNPGAGIPSAALMRYPFPEYHTDADNRAVTFESRAEEFVSVLLDVVEVLESDFVPRMKYRVPVHLSRFDLYADYHLEKLSYQANQRIFDSLWDGLSLFDICLRENVEFTSGLALIRRMIDLGLAEEEDVTPEYARKEMDFASSEPMG